MATIDFNLYSSSAPRRMGCFCVPYCDVLSEALAEAQAMELGRPEFEADGEIHRFALPGETGGKKSGWAIAWNDGVPAVMIANWKTGEAVKVTGADERFSGRPAAKPVSAEDMERSRRRMEEAQARREAERQAADEEAVRWSAEAYESAGEPSAENAYAAAKKIRPLGGVRETSGGTLLVPLYGSEGRMKGVQRIYADGSKKFAGGLAVKGRFAWIEGSPDGPVAVCEGWATGCSVSMATGLSVLCAMNAGNVEAACESFRKASPGRELVFCADNDRWTKKGGVPCNVGVEAMKAAAAKFGGRVCIPEFSSLDGSPTDFNDLFVREGAQAVKEAVLPEAGGAPVATNWGLEAFSGSAPAQEWLVDQTLPKDAACLLAAAGGTGKGMLELDLGLRVAGGEAESGIDLNVQKDTGWLGMRVCRKGKVLIFSAEDNRDDIHRRLQSIDPDGSRRARAKGNLFIVPLPDDGGPFPLVKAKEGWHQGYETTPQFDSIVRQAKAMGGVELIVVDPLASFVTVDVNADPQAGAFVQGALARLAKQSGGATVLLAHHMRKAGDRNAKSAEDARDLIRGTTALVDGVRLALAVWPADAKTKKAASKALDRPVSPRDVFCAAVVKSNCPSDNAVKTLVRHPSGLLKAFVPSEGSGTFRTSELLDTLASAVRIKCAEGRPYSATGMSGVYARRDELPDPLCEWSRHRLEEAVQDLLKDGRIVRCQLGRTAKWLDVPSGPLATKPEDYEFADGSTSGRSLPKPGSGEDGKSW